MPAFLLNQLRNLPNVTVVANYDETSDMKKKKHYIVEQVAVVGE